MASLALLRDQRFTPLQVLLDEDVLQLRNPLFQFPVCVVASHINRLENTVQLLLSSMLAEQGDSLVFPALS